jgi:hypothetical protein
MKTSVKTAGLQAKLETGRTTHSSATFSEPLQWLKASSHKNSTVTHQKHKHWYTPPRPRGEHRTPSTPKQGAAQRTVCTERIGLAGGQKFGGSKHGTKRRAKPRQSMDRHEGFHFAKFIQRLTRMPNHT